MDPLNYFEKIYRDDAYQYGTVKIVPPESFKPGLAFDKDQNVKIPLRHQVLQDLSQGKPFYQDSNGLTYREFEESCKKAPIPKTKEDFLEIEKQYWEYVENQVGE